MITTYTNAHRVAIARWTNGPRMHRVLRCTASALDIGKGRVPNFCHDFGKASELTQNAQRVASALCVYRACAPRMSGAGLARSTHVRRAFLHSCVELRTHFWACSKIPTHTANDDECIAWVQRARRTSNEWWRTPSERQRTGQNWKFSMRRPCVPHASPLCDRAFRCRRCFCQRTHSSVHRTAPGQAPWGPQLGSDMAPSGSHGCTCSSKGARMLNGRHPYGRLAFLSTNFHRAPPNNYVTTHGVEMKIGRFPYGLQIHGKPTGRENRTGPGLYVT